MDKNLRPMDVFDLSIVDSRFQNHTIDGVIENIIFVTHSLNRKVFEPFSWSEYFDCSNLVSNKMTYKDQQILEALVHGGKPLGLPVCIEPGYLTKKGGKYFVTDQFLEVVSKALHIAQAQPAVR